MAMTTQIADCLTSSCALFRDVAALLIANYQNYRNVGLTDKQTWTVVWQCTGTPPSAPDPDLASLPNYQMVKANLTNCSIGKISCKANTRQLAFILYGTLMWHSFMARIT
jgi:hypothetical protein